jgi:GT2 family glycosyltransferase/glycosyltransferase involved in cell wall biosynthesis
MGSEGTPRVVTVVVTFNGLADTLVCVESLLRTTYSRHAIVVVDNGSSGEAEAVQARFGAAVTTIEAGRNLGYGAGANLGIRWALDHEADYVWVLNNDTVVPPETIGRLAGALEADPRIGIVSPQITAPEGAEAPGGIWFAGGVIDLGRGETRHLVAPIAAGSGSVPSAFLTGCGLMIRAEVLRQVGLFWERLFLYWEDTDLGLRVQWAGWTTCVVADAWIHHAIHGSTDTRVVAYYHFRNALLVTWRHARRGTLARATAHLAGVVTRRWASAALRRRPAPLSETRGLAAGIATVVRWSLRSPRDARLAPPPKSKDARPLAIVHVVRRYSPLLGGTETYVRDLAEAQARQGHRVTVLTLDRDVTGVERGRLPSSEELAGVRLSRLPGFGNRRFAVTGQPVRLAREIARADVVHLHDLRFMVGTACLAARVHHRPVILHSHGLLFHTPWARRLKRFMFRAYYGPLLRLCGAAVAASSEADRGSLLELVPHLARRTVVVENAIQLAPLLRLPRRPIRRRILAFGRVSRTKSLDRLLEAVATIKKSDWELWIAGAEEPAERARLEAVALERGIGERVRFHGPYSDESFGKLLASADLAAFPSGGEGFGLALLEAMAAAVPVLANDIPAHRALLGPDLAGNLIDFGAAQRAGVEIARLLEMGAPPKLALGDRERARAAQYDEPRLLRDIETLYESLGVRSRPLRS